ncbi:Hypothetical protein FKW44_019847 [Caligus rogercresseyi]|uniref:Uncharacterized protein n=1 Tax=Caligus rogercresseyi TaxID=217165 RepID=A0A7T8GWG6_CALRO|nr:Hypothetical protein FKW44_019847 [Caligus rogercresseyi]
MSLHAATQGRERMLQLARQSVHCQESTRISSNLSKGCDDVCDPQSESSQGAAGTR